MNQSATPYEPGQGLPVAAPVGAREQTASVQVSAISASSGTTNTAPSSPHGGRLGARQLARLAEQLSDRDRRVLERVDEHRYMTTRQVEAFVFGDHSPASAGRTTRRVLARLERELLLRRLPRRIGGVRAGSGATVWQLAPAGTRLLHAGGRMRSAEPSLRYLWHCLAVADVHLSLGALRALDTVEDVTVQVEPSSWRRYLGSGGEARWLQPDLWVQITTTDYIDRYFVEVDLGTESLPVLLRKCALFEAYRTAGIEQEQTGSFPLVLWCFSDPERAVRLEHAIAQSPRLTSGMYVITTTETLHATLRGGLA